MSTTMHNANDKFMLNKNVKEDNNNNTQNTFNNNNINNKKNLKISNSNVTTNFDSANLNQPQHQSQLDIERENRLSQIIALYSKGLTQSEIAEKMKVNQSTISRDLKYLQQEAKKNIWKYLNEDILFEYLRYIVGNNEILKKLWEIVQDENTSAKDKTNALSLLKQSYTKRLEILMNGVESFKNVKKNISEINEHDKIENDPLLKLSTKLHEMDKGFLFRKR